MYRTVVEDNVGLTYSPAVAYELRGGEQLGMGLVRVQLAQLDDAAGALRGLGGGAHGEARHDALHDARTRLRMLRAMLKLQRPALDRAAFDRENGFLRESARLLSTARDAHVLQQALVRSAPDPGGVAELCARLEAESREAQKRLDEQGVATTLARSLAGERERFLERPPTEEAAIWQGLRLTYGRARRAAADAHTTEQRHEWRKRVKDLRYQVRFLQPLWPATLGPHEKALHHLSDLLGEDHDLAVLDQWLMVAAGGALPAGLAEALGARREKLQREARSLAPRVLGERGRPFVERLAAYARVHPTLVTSFSCEVY
jgi:CHAD domain-containing protein